MTFWSAEKQAYYYTNAGYNQVFENIERTGKEEANCEKKQWICKSSVGGVVITLDSQRNF